MGAITNHPLGAGLAGLVLGGILTWSVVGAAPAPDSSGLESHVDRLTFAVEDMSEQVGLLLAETPGAASLPPQSIQRSPEIASVSPELAERLDRLDAALMALSDSLVMAVRAQTSENTPPPLENIDRPANLVALEILNLNEEVDNDLQHLNWSYQRVLDAYGKPDASRPSPGGIGHKWYYELPNGKQVIFWFVGGQVARAMALD